MITLEDNSTASIWEFMNSSLDDTSDRTRPEQIVLTIVFVIYTIIGILGNALVLVSIMRIRHWSGLERAMMCFLTNLAISDFLLCLITFPATAISAIHNTWVLGIDMCWIVGFATSYLRIVSILFMMWIGVHRAFVIKYPFSKKITRRIARVISVCVWVLATIPQLTCYIGISPMHYDPNRAVCIASLLGDHIVPVMVYTLVYLVIPMGTIIGVYSLLLYIAIGAVRRTKDLTELQNDDETPRRGLSVAHRRAFGTVFAQIGGFLLCFLPFVIFVGLSKIDKDIIPTRVQVYGACSSSMSAIINPIIYMNTNKTFKRFVINLLKCRNVPTNPTSTAVASQTFRNPSALVETRVIRNSTICPVGYNQDGPRFVPTARNKLAVEGTRGYRRSKSEVANSNLLSPHVTIPSRAKTACKRITFHGFLEPECPETNQDTLYNSSSSSDSEEEVEKVVETTTLSADIPEMPQSSAPSGAGEELSSHLGGDDSRSLSSNSDTSVVFELPAVGDVQTEFCVVNSDRKGGSVSDDLPDREMACVSPVEDPQITESGKFEQCDSISSTDNQTDQSMENQKPVSQNSPLDCSPRISMNVNRLLTLKVKQ
ncbi:hypothetical protein ACHWQZ_G000755 [Mnemiopsis leidyi]